MADNKETIVIQTRIEGLDKMIDSIRTTRDFAKAMRELQSLTVEAGDTFSAELDSMRTRIGQARDQFNDLNDSVALLSASPVENLTNSFGGMGTALRNLDFGGATNAAKAFNASLANFKISDLTNEFKTFLVTLGSLGKTQTANAAATRLSTTATSQDAVARTADATATRGLTVATEGATVATNTFSAALKGTGILLLVTAVIALIANFDKLKESGGLLGRILTGISSIITTVTKAVKDFTDLLGLTNFAAQEQLKTQKEIDELMKEGTIKNYDRLISQLEAIGANPAFIKQYKAMKELDDITAKYTQTQDKLREKLIEQLSPSGGIDLIKAQTQAYEEMQKAEGKQGPLWFFSAEQSDRANKRAKEIVALQRGLNEELAKESARNVDLIKLQEQRKDKLVEIENLRAIAKIQSDKTYNDEMLQSKNLLAETIKNEYEKTRVKEKLSRDSAKLEFDQRIAALDAEKAQIKYRVSNAEYTSEAIAGIQRLNQIEKEKAAATEVYEAQIRDSRKKTRDASIKEAEDIAKNAFDTLKLRNENILKDEEISMEKRRRMYEAGLTNQIAFIEQNKKLLFPLDPNLSLADATAKQTEQARAAAFGLRTELTKTQAERIQIEKNVADSIRESDAKIMSARAKSLEQIHASEINNLRVKYENETKIVDFKNMTQDEIRAYQLSEEARRMQFEKDLNDLKIKQQEELTQRRLSEMEREVEYAKSRSITGSPFGIGAGVMTALDMENQLKLEQMRVQMEKEIAVVGLTEEKKDSIRQYYAQKEKELNQELYLNKVDSIKKTTDEVVKFAQVGASLTRAIFDLQTQEENNRLQAGEKLSKETQRKQFNRNKAAGIVDAIISTAQGVMNAYASIKEPITASIFAALTAATGAVQIATISRQKFNPDDTSGSSGSLSNIGGGTMPNTNQTNISTPTLFGLGQFNPTNFPGNTQQRVYVLESDITRAQNNVKQVQVAANF
jgi:uncharacterized membrane protein HdeD (DUF308 family)